MNKITKNEKIFKKFIKQFDFILNDLYIKNTSLNHYDQHLQMIKFTLIILFYLIKKNQIEIIKTKKNELIKIFISLYKNQNFSKYYDLINNNLESKWISKVNFTIFANNLLIIFNRWINNKNLFCQLINNGLNFIFLNNIECKITLKNYKDITKKDKQINFILQNTILFAKLKEIILTNFKNNVNDLIVLILGLSKKMYKN